jgi:hydrocephalus-inducing protein
MYVNTSFFLFEQIPVRFAPRDQKDYAFAVPFQVNGNTRINITVVGSGIPAKLEILAPAQRSVSFGVVNVGQEVTRQVRLINRSRRALPLRFVDQLLGDQGRLEQCFVNVYPTTEIVLAPKAVATFDIRFAPTRRIPQFHEDLFLEYAGLAHNFLLVSGRSQGMDISLETDSLPFGSVCEGSFKTKRVQFQNTGDLSAQYQWQSATLGPHFIISPISGILAPASEVSFNVTFKPVEVNDDIRQENMLLTLTGLSPFTLTCTVCCCVLVV